MPGLSPARFYLLAAALGVAGAAPFVDLDGALVFDPDLRIDDLLVYHAFFRDWSPGLLTAPAPNVYFEGHSLIYGLVLHLYTAIAALFGYVPPLREASIATVSIVGALAHVGATMVFFATARRLTHSGFAALALTVLFALSPQVLAIDLIRIDRLMILPLMIVLNISVVITQGAVTVRHGMALGAAMAVLAATKITGVLFGVLPVLAAAAILFVDKSEAWSRVRAGAIAAVATGIPVFALVMIRHFIHWERFIANVAEGYAMQMKWTSVLPSTPLFYYNVDLFAGYGAAFLALVAISVVIIAIRAVFDRDPISLWLLISLAMFSGAGMAVFKYDRGGYHLVPLYLFALAIAVRFAMDVFAGRVFRRRRWGEGFAAAALLLLPVAAVGDSFAGQSAQAFLRESSVVQTRVKSRDWIVASFNPGERVCMMASSQWANPPFAGQSLQVTTAPLDIPYLDGAAMADYAPPRLYQLRASCDAVVLNDLHNAVYLNNFTTRGYTDRRREWDTLLAELRTAYPPKVFDGGVKAYFVSRVEVFDLRARRADNKLPSRAEILAGTFDGAFTFAGERIPVVAHRFTGAVDSVAHHAVGRFSASGWAVDAERQEPAAGIILVDGAHIIGFAGTGTVRRPDVAAAFEIPDYQLAGFAACSSSNAARVRVFALGRDGVAGELTGRETAAVTNAPLPYPCLSFEGP